MNLFFGCSQITCKVWYFQILLLGIIIWIGFHALWRLIILHYRSKTFLSAILMPYEWCVLHVICKQESWTHVSAILSLAKGREEILVQNFFPVFGRFFYFFIYFFLYSDSLWRATPPPILCLVNSSLFGLPGFWHDLHFYMLPTFFCICFRAWKISQDSLPHFQLLVAWCLMSWR